MSFCENTPHLYNCTQTNQKNKHFQSYSCLHISRYFACFYGRDWSIPTLPRSFVLSQKIL